MAKAKLEIGEQTLITAVAKCYDLEPDEAAVVAGKLLSWVAKGLEQGAVLGFTNLIETDEERVTAHLPAKLRVLELTDSSRPKFEFFDFTKK